MDGPLLERPHDRASHSEWMAYAMRHGMSAEETRRRTRDQLRACFPRLIGAEPDIERHQGTEALAARRGAARKPWERA